MNAEIKTRDVSRRLLLMFMGGIALLCPLGTREAGHEIVLSVQILALSVFTGLLLADLARRKIVLPDPLLLWLSGLLVAAFLAGSIRAASRSHAMDLFAQVLTAVVLFMLAQRLFTRDQKAKGMIMNLCVAAAAVQAGLILIGAVTDFQDPVPGMIPNPNHQAVFLAAGGVLALCGLLGGPSMRARVFFASMLAVIACGVVITTSRAGVLALVIGALIPLARWRKMLLFIPILFVLLAIILPTPFSKRLKALPRDAYSFERITIWHGSFEMFRDYPVVGVGVGQYQYFFPQYSRPVVTEHAAARYGKTARHAHNEFLHIAAEMGFMGIAVAMAWMIVLFRRSAAIWRHGKLCDLAPVGGLVPLLFGSFFSPVFYQPCVLYFTAVLSGAVMGPAGELRIRSDLFSGTEARLFKVSACVGVAVLMVGLFVMPYAADREFRQAKSAINSGDLNGGLSRVERAIRLHPYRPAYHVYVSELILEYLGNNPDIQAYHRIKRHLREAIRLNPNESRTWRILAEVERKYFEDRVGSPELFEAGDRAYARAVTLDPNNGILIFRRATFSLMAGRWDAGDKMLRKAIELEPNFVGAHHTLAYSLRSRGRGEEAEKAEADLAAVRLRMRGYRPMSRFEEELLAEP
ncbi:O-antigen ligase family protein [Acidobacteriota bacterium]